MLYIEQNWKPKRMKIPSVDSLINLYCVFESNMVNSCCSIKSTYRVDFALYIIAYTSVKNIVELMLIHFKNTFLW